MRRRRSAGSEAAGILGAINLDKPVGMTSHDAVDAVRRLYGTRRVGHTGTLDPDASGVLPLLLGGATRFAEYLQHLGKTYRVRAQFGTTTDTQDASGTVLSTSPLQPAEADVLQALQSFLGESEQLPPMHSAIRVGGRRLYELAREGQTVERALRRISVDRIAEVGYQYPSLSFEISVSSGTYVRTICHDLGQKLGCGAVMAELRRLVVGPFVAETSISLEELSRRSEQERREALWSLEKVFAFLPAVRVGAQGAARVGHGRQLEPGHYESSGSVPAGSPVCILSPEGKMLAMGQGRLEGEALVIAPVRVLSEAAPAAPAGSSRDESRPPGSLGSERRAAGRHTA